MDYNLIIFSVEFVFVEVVSCNDIFLVWGIFE